MLFFYVPCHPCVGRAAAAAMPQAHSLSTLSCWPLPECHCCGMRCACFAPLRLLLAACYFLFRCVCVRITCAVSATATRCVLMASGGLTKLVCTAAIFPNVGATFFSRNPTKHENCSGNNRGRELRRQPIPTGPPAFTWNNNNSSVAPIDYSGLT